MGKSGFWASLWFVLKDAARCCCALLFWVLWSPALLLRSKWCRRIKVPAHRGRAMPGRAIAGLPQALGLWRRRTGPAHPAPAMQGQAIAGRMGAANMCQAGVVPAHRGPAMPARGIARGAEPAPAFAERGHSCRPSARPWAKAWIARPMPGIGWASKPRGKKPPCSRNWPGRGRLPHKFAPCGPYPTSMRKPHDPACGDRMPLLRGSNAGEPPASG